LFPNIVGFAKSIIVLIDSLDIKDFEEHGIQNKFDGYMEQILQEIHAVCEWAGWEDHK
jgi:hypothetical protein